MSETLINKTPKEALNVIDEYMVMLTERIYKDILKGEAIAYEISKFQQELDVLQLLGKQWKKHYWRTKMKERDKKIKAIQEDYQYVLKQKPILFSKLGKG